MKTPGALAQRLEDGFEIIGGVFQTVGAIADDVLVASGPMGARTLADLRRDVATLMGHLPIAREHDEVVVVCRDRYLFAAGLLAAWGAGFCVALPPSSRVGGIDGLANRTGAATILHDTDAEGGLDLRAILAPIPPADSRSQPPAAHLRTTHAPFTVPPDRMLVAVYTSGSTRELRRIPKTARQLYAEVATLQATFHLEPGQRVVATVPPHHLYGLLFSVLWPMAVGATLSRDLPLHVEAIVEALVSTHPAASEASASGRGTSAPPLLVTVPAHLAGFPRVRPEVLRGLRVFSSTAPLASDLARHLVEAQQIELIEVFGSTETGGIAWRQADGDGGWTALSGVSITADESGHLCVTSEFLPSTEVYRSEDRVALHADGTFTHLGRADDIVKVGGRRVSLGHLEAELRAVQGVHDVGVIAVSDPGPRGVRIIAAVVAPGLTADDLRRALAPTLDATTIPRRFVFLDALPREAHGKLRRDRLLEVIATRAPRGGREPEPEFAAPAPAQATSREIELRYRTASEGASPSPDVLDFDVLVPVDAWHFDGHFPGFPILPGISLLHSVVLRAISMAHPGKSERLREVTRLKFRRPIQPGDRLTLLVTHHSELVCDFVVRRDARDMASGRLRFASS